jgi:hypothetical protein
LKILEHSIESFKNAKKIAKVSGSHNIGIIISCDEAIARLEIILNNARKRIVDLVLKRKHEYEAGHCEYMKRNKRYSFKKTTDLSY